GRHLRRGPGPGGRQRPGGGRRRRGRHRGEVLRGPGRRGTLGARERHDRSRASPGRRTRLPLPQHLPTRQRNTANYTAADIKEIRQSTGAGMLDVKQALDEADGDKTKAVELIRVKGLKGIAKREGRTASEGLIAVDIRDSEGGQTGTMVELNSETDFVAKNDKFVALGDEAVAAAVESGAVEPEDLADTPFGEALTNAGATMGEKILVRRIGRVSGEVVSE